MAAIAKEHGLEKSFCARLIGREGLYLEKVKARGKYICLDRWSPPKEEDMGVIQIKKVVLKAKPSKP
eukprot:2562367-Karenia_brevis.AAC.1